MSKVTEVENATTGDRAEAQSLLAARGWTLGEAAARVGVSPTTFSQWLREEYKGDNARIGQLVRRWMDTEHDMVAARTAGLNRHADLAVTEQIERVARHAHANADVAVVFGAAGGGKSWGLERYCAQNTGAWCTAMSPAVTTPAAVLSRIARKLDVADGVSTAAARLEQVIVDRLSADSTLMVVDEAHHLTQPLLDVLRCVHDQAGCGLVLAGNEPLWSRLASGERAAQLVSRVGLTWRLRKPAAADAVELAATLLGSAPDSKAKVQILAAAGGMGGLRAVRKLIGQAQLLALGEGRDHANAADVADAGELLRAV